MWENNPLLRQEVEDLLKTTFVHETTLYSATEVIGDRNCLFRTFSKFLFGVEDSHQLIRKMIVNFVSDNWQEYEELVDEASSTQGIFFDF